MSGKRYILAIDQGTSSTKSLIFDEEGRVIAKGLEPLQTNYLDHGFVEQDPEEIVNNVLASVNKCLTQFTSLGHDPTALTDIGISNQRETFVVWDKGGKALYPAVVWQCKRSVAICENLSKQDLAETIQAKTGLIVDPYFSATKLIWLFQHNETIRQAIRNGEAYFGTIDTWLLYKFTGGKQYATDYTNASRTLFFNLYSLEWDKELIEAFGLNGLHLPSIHPSSFSFGKTTLNGLFKQPVAISALIGDSHSAAFGEGCFETGSAKTTLGTGCSILMNIGDKPVRSKNGMVTTICWSTQERIDYAFEGIIVSCGATIEWLKNELQLFSESKETASIANMVNDNGGVYLIPAFSGLGSPHWQMDRRASISGMTFGTTKAHIVRAALESIPYQIRDVITAMEIDACITLKELNANGGITSNQFVMQFLADLLNKSVACKNMPDISAQGAAWLAGLEAGVFESLDHLKRLNGDKNVFQASPNNHVDSYYDEWRKRILTTGI